MAGGPVETTGSAPTRARQNRVKSAPKKFNRYELIALVPSFLLAVGVLKTHTALDGAWLLGASAFTALLIVSIWRVLVPIGILAMVVYYIR